MKSLFFIIFLFVSFQSCMEVPETQEREDDQERGTAPQIGEPRWEIRALSGEEGSLARDFCRSLDRKRNIFRRDYLGANLNFKVERRDCGLSKEAAEVTVRLSENPISGDLEFVAQSFDLPVMEEVQTVDRGIFNEFCPGYLSRSQSTNTMDYGDRAIQQFKFESVGAGIRAQVKTLQIVDGLEKATALDELTLSNVARSGRPEGLMLDRIRIESCDDSSTNTDSFYWRQRL